MIARSLLALTLLCGCAGTQLVPPSQGGPAWYRVEGPAFTLYTDVDRDAARKTAAELERTFEAMLAIGWQAKGRPTRRVRVVVFRDEDTYRRFGGEHYEGYYRPNVLFTPWAVTFAAVGFTVLQHELVHDVAEQALRRQPTWLSEGLADYFSTAHFEGADFVLGDAPEDRYALLALRGPMPSAELLSWSGPPQSRLYASAWLLTHYLLHQRGDAFARYQAKLAAGAPFDAAWHDAFFDLSTERLDTLLAEHLPRARFGYAVGRPALPAPAISVTAMSDADVHALWAVMELACLDCDHSERVMDEHVSAALREDPENYWAAVTRLVALPAEPPLRRQRIELFARQHSESWLAWTLLALTLDEAPSGAGDQARAAEAYDRAVQLSPHEPNALVAAGLGALRRGALDRAEALTSRALRLGPSLPTAISAHAAVLRATQQCAALDALVRDADALQHDHPDRALHDSLVEQQTQCTTSR